MNYIQIEWNDYASPLQLHIYRFMVINDDIDIMRMLKSKNRNIFRFLEIFLGSEIHVNTDCNFVTIPEVRRKNRSSTRQRIDTPATVTRPSHFVPRGISVSHYKISAEV